MSEKSFTKTKTFIIAVGAGIGTTDLLNSYSHVAIKNIGTKDVGVGFITDAQDGLDMTDYASRHASVDMGEVRGFPIGVKKLKHIGNGGTSTLEVLCSYA